MKSTSEIAPEDQPTLDEVINTLVSTAHILGRIEAAHSIAGLYRTIATEAGDAGQQQRADLFNTLAQAVDTYVEALEAGYTRKGRSPRQAHAAARLIFSLKRYRA